MAAVAGGMVDSAEPTAQSSLLNTVLLLYNCVLFGGAVTGTVFGSIFIADKHEPSLALFDYEANVVVLVVSLVSVVAAVLGILGAVGKKPLLLAGMALLVGLVVTAGVMASLSQYYYDRVEGKLAAGWPRAAQDVRRSIEVQYMCCGWSTPVDAATSGCPLSVGTGCMLPATDHVKWWMWRFNLAGWAAFCYYIVGVILSLGGTRAPPLDDKEQAAGVVDNAAGVDNAADVERERADPATPVKAEQDVIVNTEAEAEPVADPRDITFEAQIVEPERPSAEEESSTTDTHIF